MITPWNVIGASVEGTSHLKSLTPCQDASAYLIMESGVLLAAVSDGAGSASRSDTGSQLTVNYAIEIFYNKLVDYIPENHAEWGQMLADVFQQTRDFIRNRAEQEALDAREFACTLTIVVIDHEWLVTGQLGDGLAVVQTEEGELVVVGVPQRGEYADSTYFITDKNSYDIFWGNVFRQGIDISNVNAVALMTDGLTNLAIDRETAKPYEPFFNPLLRIPADITDHESARIDLLNFLTSDRINSRTDDDKTLILGGRFID